MGSSNQINWKRLSLGDIATLQRGHDLPDAKRKAGNIPIMGSFGITGTHSTAKAKGPGVTIGRSGGSIGVVSYIESDYWPLNTCLYVKDFHGNNPLYIYYLLKTLDLASLNSGSAQPSLNRNFVHPIPINVPEPDEQDQIVNLLSILDNKISLNHQINETLEAVAQALFKSWFVDFDLVKAKAEGCKPEGVNDEIISLFPSTFIDSPLGAIPEGWKVLPLIKCSSALRRGISPCYVENGGTRVINQKCVRNGQIDFKLTRRHNDAKKPIKDRLLESGDILINSTGVGTLGRVAQLWYIDEPTTFDSHVTIVRANQENISPVFLGLELLRKEAKIESLGEGSTGQTELSREILGNLLVAAPPIKIQKYFAKVLLPIIDKVTQNQLQSITLSNLRGLLLPRLISGKLRVDEISETVEALAL